jgi:four helix bundle protein
MTPEEMKARTKKFGLRILKLADSLPNSFPANSIGKQLVRSGTSVGANYRATCRAKSIADFISKLSIVEEECDESIYWMEILTEANIVEPRLLSALIKEADEIVAIVVKSIKTAKLRRTRKSPTSRSVPNNPKSEFPNPKSR